MRFSVAVRLFLNFYNQQYFFQIGHFEIFVSFMDPITPCVEICYLGMCGMCHAVVPHSPFSTNINYTCTRATVTSSGSIRDISISDFQGQHCQLFRKCFYLLFSMSSRHVLLDNSCVTRKVILGLTIPGGVQTCLQDILKSGRNC